ncbi:MAG TPA: DinB family protein [Candidatus Limnocylindria bacterium]|nr:DinB family protein [Candidatus Limnocylindria bacterium]
MGADTLELAKQRSKLTREQVLRVVDGLTDEQFAWRPAPRAHSMGWTLWHIARCADKLAAEIAGTDEIWAREGLAVKWGLPDVLLGSNGVGTGVDDDTAATLRPPSMDPLIDYARRSFAALDVVVDHFDADDIARERRTFFFDDPAALGRAFIASIAHDNRHLGELEYVKGLLGLRGSATR